MKLNLKILTLLLIGLFSMHSSLSYADETTETVQLSLVITAADQINLTAVKQVEKGLINALVTILCR